MDKNVNGFVIVFGKKVPVSMSDEIFVSVYPCLKGAYGVHTYSKKSGTVNTLYDLCASEQYKEITPYEFCFEYEVQKAAFIIQFIELQKSGQSMEDEYGLLINIANTLSELIKKIKKHE